MKHLHQLYHQSKHHYDQ